MSTSTRIVLLLERQIGHCRSVLSGIQRFALQRPGWIFHEGPPDIHILPRLREWHPHGIIGHVYTQEMYNALKALRIPMVVTTRTLLNVTTPDVDVDHIAIGQMAADYFLRKGFRHFGYFGSGHARFSLERECGFRNTLRRHGFDPLSCHMEYLPMPPIDASWRRLDLAVSRWLQRCPKPLALFVSNDIPARQISGECRRLGLAIPREIAILGVDNDEYECGLAAPPLSSIAIPSEEIGFTAASMLDQLVRNRQLHDPHPICPPLHVISRPSTNHFVMTDRVVHRALQFIKSNINRPFTVEDVRRACAVSRRILERRFRSATRNTALQAIHHARVENAKPFLESTRLDLNTIAEQCGFSSARQMAAVFRKHTGHSPAYYRRRWDSIGKFKDPPARHLS